MDGWQSNEYIGLVMLEGMVGAVEHCRGRATEQVIDPRLLTAPPR